MSSATPIAKIEKNKITRVIILNVKHDRFQIVLYIDHPIVFSLLRGRGHEDLEVVEDLQRRNQAEVDQVETKHLNLLIQ